MKLKHIVYKEKGQAMVEFALVLPILLLLLGGIIDFGWIYHNQLAANNASREAARFIAVHYVYDKMTPTIANEEALDIIEANTSLSNITIIDSVAPVSVPNEGKKVTVKFSGKVTVLTPMIRVIIDSENDGFVINASTTMRLEE